MTEDVFYKDLLESLFDGVYYVDRERRIQYWNSAAERLSGFVRDEVVGHRCMDNILRHVNSKGLELCRGRCPLQQTMIDGRSREAEVFMHHKSGHRVPVLVRAAPIRDPSGAVIGAVEVFSDAGGKAAERQRIVELERLAHLDGLTEVANRRYLDLHLGSKLMDFAKLGWPMGILMVDIDRFKSINDEHGHQVGDRVLKMVAKTMSLAVRTFDVVGRYGGEEFLVVSVNVDAEQLSMQAERLRALVEQSSLEVDGRPLSVTASFGGTVAKEGDTAASMLSRADGALYESKVLGRNRYTLAT
ncbi:MAG: sensor domain-containing diguanylate cyclase [Holophagales bacterium]|nr:MAG: sensor domain-containing diguanylate cyclase [Holophagales bacterium]